MVPALLPIRVCQAKTRRIIIIIDWLLYVFQHFSPAISLIRAWVGSECPASLWSKHSFISLAQSWPTMKNLRSDKFVFIPLYKKWFRKSKDGVTVCQLLNNTRRSLWKVWRSAQMHICFHAQSPNPPHLVDQRVKKETLIYYCLKCALPRGSQVLDEVLKLLYILSIVLRVGQYSTRRETDLILHRTYQTFDFDEEAPKRKSFK